MKNLAMQRKLQNGEARDLSPYRQAAGIYKLPFFIDGLDYCDKTTEEWIWSIGENYETKEIWAATDCRYYKNPLFQCLWLR